MELTELQAITDEYVDSTGTDIYFSSNALLYMLLKRGKTIPGGERIKEVLEYGKGNGGAYGAKTKLALGKKEIFNAAFFTWAAYYAGVTIDLEDTRQNSGDLAVVNLVQGKLSNAQKTIRDDMGSQIYTALASNVDNDGNPVGFSGLADLFNTTTSFKYGNIAQDDMALWKANAITTSQVISFAIMQGVRRAASIDTNMEGKPDMYLTTEVLKDAFEASLQQQARYQSKTLAAAGFDTVLFGGKPVVADDNIAANNMYALNLKYLDILTHKDFNFTKPKWASPIDQPDSQVAFIRWSGQLVCRNRKAHARHTNMQAA